MGKPRRFRRGAVRGRRVGDPRAAMPPEDEMDFTLDRPFLFVITNAGGLPLFAGIVNHPAG